MIRALLLAAALLVPSAALAQEQPHSRLTHALIIGNLALNGIENGQSLYLFGQNPDRFKEANPILRPFQHNPTAFGGVKLGMVAGISGFNLWLDRKYPRSRAVKWALVIQNAVMAGVVIRNARLQ